MASQMQQQVVPLDFNNLGGADQNNYDNNYNNGNTMNGYPRGSYMNERNNNYNPNFANQTQRINNNYNQSNFNEINQQNFSNTLNNNYNRNMNINNDNYNQNINQNYNNMNNNNNGQNINNGMNEYVRKELSSHGLNLRSPSPSQIRREEQERKKMLLNNIQSQINLTKKTKLEELRKRQEEDAKYLKDMVVCFPFGRGGGGAPIRDKSGNIVTNRRALISDPKYNLAQINVDDDYYDVWDKEKRIGRYYRNNAQMNGNNNNNYNNNNQQLSNTAQNFGGINMNNQGEYNNQDFYDFQQNYGRPYSTNPRVMNNNYNYNNGQMMDYNQQDYNSNNHFSNNQQFSNTLRSPNTRTISLTYDNYEVMDRDQQKQVKENYRQDLLNQMKENENKKLLERKRKELEEAREEERLRKEREELERLELEEKNKNQQLQNRVRNENNILISEKNQNNNNGQNEEFNKLRTVKTIIRRTNITNENDNNITDQEAIDKINQKEMESKMQLNNEILKLREQMKDQQNDLFNQIQFLKQETQNANQQRFDALKEIEILKGELSKQRADEDLRRKYVYDVVVNDARTSNNIIQETHLPGQEKPQIVLPVPTEKEIYYDEQIRHPNRIIPVPKLTELNEHGVKTDSKFIDMETHNIFGGLELYEPNNKLINSEDDDYKINNKGIGIEGDYGTLRSYGDNILKSSDVLLPNTSELNKNTVNISINNKNVKSFKNIKNVETNKDGDTENININLETEDDGAFEVNRIYNKNLERLRILNEMENNYSKNNEKDLINNNMIEKDNFDDFIKKLNKPVPVNTKEEDEFEIEISRLPK